MTRTISYASERRGYPDRLIRDLKAVGRDRCAEVPTLIIDDESDQASVNTLDPQKVAGRRSAINERIVTLLRLLPRAQYIGYTATPFANVFVNLRDPDDIYPKHFIYSLERPKGYMGARDFHDFDSAEPGPNERAFVRSVPLPEDPGNDRLMEAMDAFVLTGALKVFREKHGAARFRHHTMLIHQSARRAEHAELVTEIRRLWDKAAYDSPGPSMKRLCKLFERDFKPVWEERGRPAGLKFPASFEALRPHIGAALDRIRRGDGKPVIMVNSAEGADVPDFDRSEVWKMVVGGAKLSRGYTVEGLTISYFRRRSGTHDTLMQMGRWFGYRRGYGDLVRLYIGRAEPEGKNRTIDLYKAFEVLCRDEEAFRDQLKLYQDGPDGAPGLAPKDVPAVVFNSHPRLRPTAKNKMFNAVLTWAAFDYREPTTQAASGPDRTRNAKLFERFLEAHQPKSATVTGPGRRRFDVMWSRASHLEVISLLADVRWEHGEGRLEAELAFLRSKECPIKRWIFVAPQVDSAAGTWRAAGLNLQCIARTRFATRFGVFSSSEHVQFVKGLTGEPSEFRAKGLESDGERGVLLFYPTREKLSAHEVQTGTPVMGFALALPKVVGPGRTAFTVRNPNQPDDVVVDIARTRK